MADGEADWENEDFEPAVIKKPILHTDRWEGEDEDDDVKDNWDDEEEEKEEKPIKTLEIEKKDLTPQERLAHKLKQQKLQEEADLELAKETFGCLDPVQSLDTMVLVSKEDYDSFRKLLVEKLQKCEESLHFVNFLEDLFRDLCLNVNPDDIKRFTSSLNALAHEKIKVQKAKAGKKKSKKANLNIRDDFTIIDYADEFEDCI